MTTPEIVPENNPITVASNYFHHFVGGYFIGLPCILCDNQTVFLHDIYYLIDFINNGGIIERAVKFFDAYRTGYIVTIVVLDLESGELMKRKHRLNNETISCDWVLMDTDHLDPKDRRDELLEFKF